MISHSMNVTFHDHTSHICGTLRVINGIVIVLITLYIYIYIQLSDMNIRLLSIPFGLTIIINE